MILKRILPDESLIKVAIDTSSLIRLFQGDWHDIEFKIYQNFFKVHLSPTVMMEFRYFQKLTYPLSIKLKFLELLGAETWNENGNSKKFNNNDEKIVQECIKKKIFLIITDNMCHFQELKKKYPSIKLVNGFSIPFFLNKSLNCLVAYNL